MPLHLASQRKGKAAWNFKKVEERMTVTKVTIGNAVLNGCDQPFVTYYAPKINFNCLLSLDSGLSCELESETHPLVSRIRRRRARLCVQEAQALEGSTSYHYSYISSKPICFTIWRFQTAVRAKTWKSTQSRVSPLTALGR